MNSSIQGVIVLLWLLLSSSSFGEPISLLPLNQTPTNNTINKQQNNEDSYRMSLADMSFTLHVLASNLTHWYPEPLRNFFQLVPYGPGVILSKNYPKSGDGAIAQSSCQKYETADECNKAKSFFNDHDCQWCNIPEKYKERFGDGGCLLKILMVGCVIPQMATFPYLLDFPETVVFPKAYEQAACLPYSSNKTECENGPKLTISGKRYTCKLCEVPPVYHLNPSSICMQDFMMDPFCNLLQDVPEKIIKKFEDAAELAKKSTTPTPGAKTDVIEPAKTSTITTTTTTNSAKTNRKSTTTTDKNGGTTPSLANDQQRKGVIALFTLSLLTLCI